MIRPRAVRPVPVRKRSAGTTTVNLGFAESNFDLVRESEARRKEIGLEGHATRDAGSVSIEAGDTDDGVRNLNKEGDRWRFLLLSQGSQLVRVNE